MTRAVVVTRDEPRDGPLAESLRARGLEVLCWPVVRIVPPGDPRPLEAALARAAEFDWIVFASRHAVEAVVTRLALPAGTRTAPPAGTGAPRPGCARIAAVGSATAAALRAHGWDPDVVPAEAHADALVAALARHVKPGERVLFPASSRALPALGDGLRRLGAEVVQVEAYRNESAPLDVHACRAAIEAGAVCAVTFTSPSCVEALEHALGREAFGRLAEAASAVALGPTTASALRARGIEPVLASPATLDGLAATTAQILTGSRH